MSSLETAARCYPGSIVCPDQRMSMQGTPRVPEKLPPNAAAFTQWKPPRTGEPSGGGGGLPRRLDEIVDRMLATPGAQFHIYATDKIPPGRQREIVSYRGTFQRGRYRRSTMSGSNGDVVVGQDLWRRLATDCAGLRNLFFTFTTAPVFGLASVSENRSYLQNSQVLIPSPISGLLL